jgi:hypothetical protein
MATIQVLEDLQKAYEDYPHVYLQLAIIDVTWPGDALNDEDDARFGIQATNSGPVNMVAVSLRVTGLNGTLVKSNGAAATWGPSFDLSGTYFGDVVGHGPPVVKTGFHFKPTSPSTVVRDLVRVEVIGWEADDQHFHSGHTRADPEAKAIYRSAVSTT